MKTENILLVRTTSSKSIIPPIGLLYIASVLRNKYKSCDIRIYDFMREGSGIGGFTGTLRDFHPDIIGFSSLSSEFNLFKKLSTLARDNAPESIIISGGPLATNYHTDIVGDRIADFAVVGEGETTIDELMDVIQSDGDLSSVKGIAYLKGDKAVLTAPREFIPDLDKLTFPAWDLIDLKSYTNIPNWNGVLAKKYYAPIITSRGCLFNCIYCHNLFGKAVRARSIQNVLSEIDLLYQKHAVREFHIIDDFFNFDLERVNNLCRGIIEKKLNIRISFPNGMRADRMNKETLQLLKNAGTYKINYAIETASPRLQKFIRKNLDLRKAKEVIEETSKLGIITFGFFMFGFPTETIGEMKETISFAVNSKLDTAKFLKVAAFCNTELSKLAPAYIYGDDRGYYDDNIYYDRSMNYSELPTKILNGIILESHLKFYAKLSRIWRILIKYRSFDAIRRLIQIYNYVSTERKTNVSDDTP